jgi:hypothetical protein
MLQTHNLLAELQKLEIAISDYTYLSNEETK